MDKVELRPLEQVQLGVEWVPQEQLNADFLSLNLCRQTAQACFIFIRRHTQHELLAEIIGEPLLEADRCLVVDAMIRPQDREGLSQIILR
jgi:hypothetical protein